MNKAKNTSLKSLFFLLSFFLIQGGSNVFSQLTLTTPINSPASAITNTLLGGGVSVSNITYNGSPVLANNNQNSVREFTNGTAAFPLNAGVLLQTSNAPGITDPDLTAIANPFPTSNNSITNGTIIEFDFIPDGDSLSFSYIFSSLEYTSFTCSNFNDVFGFFISGPGITGPYTNNAKNIAIIPGSTNVPVGINTVNAGTNADINQNCVNANPNWVADAIYFTTAYNTVYNSSNLPTSYNGSTVELTANATVICGLTYHIKLAISNVTDTGFDSGVFLKAGSFASTPTIDLSTSNTSSSFSDSVIVESCHQGNFCFERSLALSTDTAIVHYSLGGSAILGVDYNFLNAPNSGDSIILLPGDTSFCLDIAPVDDGIAEGPENIILSTFNINECGDTTYNTVEIWIADSPADLVTDAGADIVVCSGGVGTLDGTSTTPTNPVEWTYSGPGTVAFAPNNLVDDPGVTFVTPGTYTMFFTETNDSCALIKVDSMVVIYEELTISTSNDTIVCENGTANLFANALGGVSFDYNWSHTADLNPVQAVLPTGQTSYDVFAESSNGCITQTETITVDVLPPITLTSSASQTICPGESINVTATATGGNGGPYTYTWTNTNGPNVGNGNVYNVTPSVTTDYTVTVSDNCESTVQSSISEVVVAIIPPIEFDVVDGEICTPAEFVLFNETDSSLVQETYWYISDGQTFLDNDTINVFISEPGSYDVRMVVVTPDGCIDSARVDNMLTVYPKPEADFTYFPKPATILNTEVNFQNYSDGAFAYEWLFEQGDPTFSTLETPKITFPKGEVGTYDVELIAITINGCRDTIVKEVVVVPEVLIFVPNTFTPDGDENNPTWKAVIEGIDKTDVTIEIFNRWGEKVWESHDLEVGWDGTYGVGGSLVKSGTYIWKIKASNAINDEKYVWDGVVTVLY
ncbi:choice-of-anchor L domain-containing protein [Brumimicrobium mesophilum]|uniref:choice-of-anchor L domain-containing protein n=1 Tax=Brumimicrobium mesophilum TaxID=392717 RepID=UPI00131C0971|nr:choice-of-anchor L domain-containing protein [Brumimicrobium mesophilum]